MITENQILITCLGGDHSALRLNHKLGGELPRTNALLIRLVELGLLTASGHGTTYRTSRKGRVHLKKLEQ